MPYVGKMTKEARESAFKLCTRNAIDFNQMGLAFLDSQYMGVQKNIEQIRATIDKIEALVEFRGQQPASL